ncbi:hypothetical protein V1634_28620 [Plantactinospora veratri]|uniref:Uncharacterized protein n=1 Tax=Plantactinospora veratri TaxID=1436122 RepID=A0ABU7SLQ2_9ACTN
MDEPVAPPGAVRSESPFLPLDGQARAGEFVVDLDAFEDTERTDLPVVHTGPGR